MVKAKWVECWNMSISMLWGKCPKMKIVCGNCYHTFTDRPYMSKYITSVCPACKEVNEIPHSNNINTDTSYANFISEVSKRDDLIMNNPSGIDPSSNLSSRYNSGGID